LAKTRVNPDHSPIGDPFASYEENSVNIQQMLGQAIAESVSAVGDAFPLFPATARAERDGLSDWHAQFSAASNDQRAARRTTQALFRAATVRN
jgi:hypothetical protein